MNRAEAVLKAAVDNISDIAKRGDLDTRNNDHEDFFDGISVWSLKKALEDAYDAGRISAVVPNMGKANKLGWDVTVDEDGALNLPNAVPQVKTSVSVLQARTFPKRYMNMPEASMWMNTLICGFAQKNPEQLASLVIRFLSMTLPLSRICSMSWLML